MTTSMMLLLLLALSCTLLQGTLADDQMGMHSQGNGNHDDNDESAEPTTDEQGFDVRTRQTRTLLLAVFGSICGVYIFLEVSARCSRKVSKEGIHDGNTVDLSYQSAESESSSSSSDDEDDEDDVEVPSNPLMEEFRPWPMVW